jgi:hypothetical protein
MMEHCCDIMDYFSENKNSLLEYDPSVRSYSFYLHDDDTGTHQEFYFCPWCGTTLPKELDEEWGKILEKEYGIEDPGWKKPEELPEEFRSDTWWKKRGL